MQPSNARVELVNPKQSDLAMEVSRFRVKGRWFDLSSVVSVRLVDFDTDSSGFPIVSWTSLEVRMRDETKITICDDRTITSFGSHRLLRSWSAHLLNASRQSRLDHLAARLRSLGRVQLYQHLRLLPPHDEDPGKAVWLLAGGVVQASGRFIHLKDAKRTGALLFGQAEAGGREPGICIISPAPLGRPVLFLPEGAIKFVILAEDYDVTQDLMRWLAAGNHL